MSEKSKGALEVTVSVKRSDCLVTNLMAELGNTCTVERLKIGKNTTIHRVICPGEAFSEVYSKLKKISLSMIRVGKNTIWAEVPSCSACRYFASSDSVVLGTRNITQDTVAYRLLIQNAHKLKSMEKSLDIDGMMPRVDSISLESSDLLTARERVVLEAAYSHGYFDSDRKMTLTEIAKSLGVSPASLSDVLRRGTKKVVKYYLENLLLNGKK